MQHNKVPAFLQQPTNTFLSKKSDIISLNLDKKSKDIKNFILKTVDLLHTEKITRIFYFFKNSRK